MSAEKSDYPSRPPAMRPKKPRKGSGKPSSQSGGGRRKTWMSDMSDIKNGIDRSPRLQFPWWKAPMFVESRLKKWSN